eukprot:SAG31_NODE_9160_length_1324_cov_0.976327_3_plen_80_part_00
MLTVELHRLSLRPGGGVADNVLDIGVHVREVCGAQGEARRGKSGWINGKRFYSSCMGEPKSELIGANILVVPSLHYNVS